MVVKICGITNLDDALAAVDGGASALGFIFYPKSPRFIAAADARRIIERLPAAIWKAGVFVDEPAAEVSARAADLHLDIAQLHGRESALEFPSGVRVWKALRIPAGGALPELAPYAAAEAVLLDGASSGNSFDWRIARGAAGRIVLAGGLGPHNLREAAGVARPWGVDACSCLESAPGRKDRRALAEFLRIAADVSAELES